MSISENTRKRPYRLRVTCECGKVIDSDYKKRHVDLLHDGKSMTFSLFHDDKQQTLSGFLVKRQTLEKSVKQIPDSQETVSVGSCVAQIDQEHVLPPRIGEIADADTDDTTLSQVSSDHDSDLSDQDSSHDKIIDDTKSADASILSLSKDFLPQQPVLKEYNPKKFGKETTSRDFKPEWYKIHPWLNYDIENKQGTCFPCEVFMKSNSFKFENWKKTHRLLKHAKSDCHRLAMTKWINYRANKKQKTTVLKQLDSAHKEEVTRNRAYLKVIIECLLFTAQQNIAQRGQSEDRSNLDNVSDVNRGNFLELLHLRCHDIPWFAEKLKCQLGNHAQWTSPMVQNELLDIIASLVLKRITRDVRASGQCSIIVDETSDISRKEQVAICLRYIVEGQTKESFVGFYSTPSTEGQALHELIKDVFRKLDLKLEEIVGQCFDGAANMSGIHKGLATRMRENSPLAIYVHCYGHLLNLAIQSTMTDVVPLRNALGTIQSLYNFLEASPKRHAMFEDIKMDGEPIARTLKSLSITRWACRWEAVKAVASQLPRIVKALLEMANDRDAKIYTESSALLNAICDFEFVFGLVLLKIILSTTNSLNSYLQKKTLDVVTAKKTADATIQTLSECRNDKSFETAWETAQNFSDLIKQNITDARFAFKDAMLPRRRQVSRRLQALVGEFDTSEDDHAQPQTAKDHYRIATYFAGIDKVLAEMKSRFDGNDQDLLCSLGNVVLNPNAPEEDCERVASHYRVDSALLNAEKTIFMKFVVDSGFEMKSAASIAQKMYENDLHEVLPVYYKVVSILATIPATSCSAERSFSSLRRTKTYLRSTMGQSRLSSVALINVERCYTNMVVANQDGMDRVIDTFGQHPSRKQYFF